ncbi:class II fructose-bisphosphate aldolase [Streptomyces sp. NPDC088124]|uniref:class II fructose-bisphosphate aldolase n=1 Tax=Streptomyces sp. NPDC088124 TaxID=3154654 RepID=UPI00342B323C
MPLTPTGKLVARTASGVGAFNVVLLEQLEAVLAGAARAGLPVIVQISENAAAYRGALGPLTAAAHAAIAESGVPVALHLDHATDTDLVKEAVRLGFTSVMYDGSLLPWSENLSRTREITRRCHDHGVWVEAELGAVGGKDRAEDGAGESSGDSAGESAHTPGVRTDPAEAARFVADTGVDALAVAVGTAHRMTRRTAALDLALIAELHAAVPVPLVLHGSSGVDDRTLVAAVRAGMRKVNISTHLNGVFTAEVRDRLAARPGTVDPRRYLGPGRDAMAGEVARLLRLLAEEAEPPQEHEPEPEPAAS